MKIEISEIGNVTDAFELAQALLASLSIPLTPSFGYSSALSGVKYATINFLGC